MTRHVRQLLGGLVAASSLATSPPSPIRFEDRTHATGVGFVLRNAAAGHKYQVETLVGGVGVIDFDKDGWPDIYAVNGAALPSLEKTGRTFFNRLYRNNRDGSFTDVTEKAGVAGRGYSLGVAVGDFDNDGWDDIYVTGVNANILYRNNGDGTFTDVTRAAGVEGQGAGGKKLFAIAAAWLDFDNDGRLDLFVSNYCDWDPALEPVCGGIAEKSRTYCSPDAYRGQPNLLYHNNGDGTFTDVSLSSGVGRFTGKGMGVAVSDYDDDNRPDLFVANDNARNLLFHNRGDGTFEELGTSAGVAYNGDGRQISGMGADFRDYDGDGRPDIVMTGLSRETFELFRNVARDRFDDTSAASGMLRLSQPWSGWSCGFVDLDNDGLSDFFVANGGLDTDAPQPNRIFRNVGRGQFADVSGDAGPALQMKRLHRGAAFADFDNDGRMDVLVSSINDELDVLMNSGPRRHWLELKLRGTRSNRTAIGAKVICAAGGRRQVKWVGNSVGYASASDLRLHFGLGDLSSSISLEIRWPSGVTQKMPDVAINRILEVVEVGKAKEIGRQ